MAVRLPGPIPPFDEVSGLGKECVPVYAFMWESAARDNRTGSKPWEQFGGCCNWTVKGLAGACGMSKTTVIKALKKLLDGGFIQYAEFSTPYDRWWRVTHPDQLEAVRHAIDLMGPPSAKYNQSTRSRHDKDETLEEGEETWKAHLGFKPAVEWPPSGADSSGLENNQRCVGGDPR